MHPLVIRPLQSGTDTLASPPDFMACEIWRSVVFLILEWCSRDGLPIRPTFSATGQLTLQPRFSGKELFGAPHIFGRFVCPFRWIGNVVLQMPHRDHGAQRSVVGFIESQ